MTARGLLATLAAVLMLSGCTGSSAPADALSPPSPTGSGGAVLLSDDEAREVGIYVALLEQHLFIEPDLFDTAYIDPTPAAGEAALSEPVRAAISAHFKGRMDVRWGDSDDPYADYVTLPVVPDGRDSFRVSVTDTCGNVCGHGQRYRVTRHGDRWKATPFGATAIS
jgi:hypothetical protein